MPRQGLCAQRPMQFVCSREIPVAAVVHKVSWEQGDEAGPKLG